MNCLLWMAATIQSIQDRLYSCTGRCRRRLLPVAKHDGYDMILLHSGYWIMSDSHQTNRIPVAHIKARYNAETHTITSDASSTMKRWTWLSVVTATGEDISDFFCRLRYTVGLSLSNSDILFLFAHQKGWYPVGTMEVTLRSGFIDHICIFNGVQRIVSSNDINSQNVDYIK